MARRHRAKPDARRRIRGALEDRIAELERIRDEHAAKLDELDRRAPKGEREDRQP